MTLHLVRLPVDLRRLAAFAVANGVSDTDSGYALHLALRCRFGAAGPQPFRFLPDMRDDRGGPQLLGYASDPVALTEAAALPATDTLLAAIFGTPATQAMPDSWRAGARYRFEVRVRPVVRFGGRVREARRARAGAWLNRAGEIDAFIAACEKAGPRDEGPAVNREAVYLAWLRTRVDAAATLDDDTMVRQFQRAVAGRRRHGKPQDSEPGPGVPPPREQRRYSRTEGPAAVIGGTLAIADPVAFERLLARGVGRHAAFGFGMLLLSPPGRAG